MMRLSGMRSLARTAWLAVLGMPIAASATSLAELPQPTQAMLEAVEAARPGARQSFGEGSPFVVALGNSLLTERVPPGALLGSRQAVGNYPCVPETASVLELAGFAPEEIRSVSYNLQTRSDTNRSTRLQGSNAWIRFKDRDGYLVISFRPNCAVRTYYSRYGLDLPS